MQLELVPFPSECFTLRRDGFILESACFTGAPLGEGVPASWVRESFCSIRSAEKFRHTREAGKAPRAENFRGHCLSERKATADSGIYRST